MLISWKDVVLDFRGQNSHAVLIKRLDPALLDRTLIHQVVLRSGDQLASIIIVLASIVVEFGGNAHFTIGRQVRLATVYTAS